MAVCEECFYHGIKCRICWSLWSDDLLSLSWKVVPCYLEACSISSGRMFQLMCNSVGDVKAPLQLLFIVSQGMFSKCALIDYTSAKTYVVRIYNVTNNKGF